MKNQVCLLFTLFASFSIGLASQVAMNGPAYQQDFNSLPTGFGATADQDFPAVTDPGPAIFLPGWHTTLTDYTPGSIYSNTLNSYSNQNANRAFQDGNTDDYAFGTKTAVVAHFTLGLINNSGADFDGLTVAYNVEQYSVGTSGTTITFSYSTDGETFSTASLTGGEEVLSQTGGTTSNLANVLQTARTANVGVTVAEGSSIWFRWTYTPLGASGNAHMGIDDVSVSAVPEPATVGVIAAALLMGLLGVKRIRR